MILFPVSDAELVRRTLADDQTGFEQLIARYQKAAHAIVRSTGVDLQRIDDVVQEACLRAFRWLGKLRRPDSFRPWFLRIVRRAAVDHLREESQPGRTRTGTRELPPDEQYEAKDFEEYLKSRIRDLPEEVRDAIFLYYYDGESTGKVARDLGISRSLVKKRLMQGRDALRDRLWSEMEDCFRDMLPSVRTWERKARKLTLVVMLALPPATLRAESLAPASAGALNAALVVGAFLIVGAIGGGLVMLSKRGPDGAAGGAEGLAANLGRAPAEANPGGAVRRELVPKAEERTDLRGTVFLGDRTRPADGAQVALIRKGGAREPAITGPDGRFTVHLPRPGSYYLLAWKDAWATEAPDRLPLEVRDGEPVPEIERILVRGTVVAGAVRDALSEMPVPGARISYRDDGLQFATSDAEGRFRLDGIPPGGIWGTVTAPGYEIRRIWTQAEAGEKHPLSVELFPGSMIQGRVLTARGGPSVGAMVEAFADGVVPLECRADRDGRYRLEGIPFNAGEIRLVASLGGLFVSPTVRVELSAGESQIQMLRDLRLTEGRVLAGRVLGPDGVPLAGVDFCAGDRDESLAASNAKGEFRIEGVSSQAKGLTARKKGYAHHWIDPDKFTGGDLVLEPGHTLRRRVTDRSGSPLSRAMVLWEVHEGGLVLGASSSQDGSFELPDLPSSIHSLSVSKHGFLDHYEESVQVADRDDPVVLDEDAVILGMLVDKTTGEPIRSFSVGITAPGHNADRILTFGPADGRFFLDKLRSGNSYGLTLSADGYVERTVTRAAWPRTEEREPPPMELEPGKPLRGQVVSAATGKGLERVQAIYRSSSPGGQIIRRVTDEKGNFSLIGLPDMPGTLELEKAGFARTVFRNVLPGESEPFPLDAEAVLSGTVLDAAERPVSGARIEVRATEGPSSATVDDDGRFAVRRLPAGAARVSLFLRGVFIGSQEVTLVAGQETPLDLRQPGGSIRGTVTQGDSAVAGALVRIVGSSRPQTSAAADGSFVISDLAPGTYRLDVRRADHPRRPAAGDCPTVVVESGEASVQLRIPTGSLRARWAGTSSAAAADGGRLVLFGHMPGAGKESAAKIWGPFDEIRIPAKRSEVTFEALPQGRYCLVAYSADGAQAWAWRGPVEVGDDSRDVELTPAPAEGPEVQVFDARTGFPIAGATVASLLENDFPLLLPGKTDAEGRARIPGFPEGASVQVTAEGYVTGARRIEPAGGNITLQPLSRVLVRLTGGSAAATLQLQATALYGDPGWPPRRSRDGLPRTSGTRVPEGFQLECAPGHLEIQLDVYAGAVKGDPVASNKLERREVAPGETVVVEISLPSSE